MAEPIEPAVGQIWTPSHGTGKAKLIVRLAPRGDGIYFKAYPLSGPVTLSTYYRRDRWNAWIIVHDAKVQEQLYHG